MWVVRYADAVIRDDIPRLAHADKERIRRTIEVKLITDPLRFGKPLRHSLNHLRSLRVGDYRVLYQLDHSEKIVSVVAIGHRRDVYKD